MMLAKEMIDHIEEIRTKVYELDNYRIAFAKILENDEIAYHFIEAIDWDDDNELCLISEGNAHIFDIEKSEYTVEEFLDFFKKNEFLLNYVAFAKTEIKLTSEGGNICLHAPLVGTGWMPSLKMVYFYYEE